MKLSDLNPRWVGDGKGRTKMGVTFECPTHRDTFCRLGVMFANPVDGGAVCPARHHWQRTGETFETLTLTPSINAVDHWHGHINNGEVT